jgi:UDP-hydrolysing UDP-N-acetyl-D-glucosamine 2-epimerase
MGEEPWRVHHAGAPSIDHLHRSTLLDRPTLESRLAIPLAHPSVLAAWHPVTILPDTNSESDAFFAALASFAGQLIFVYPNTDAGSHELIERTRVLAASRPHTHIFINLDANTYWSLLAQVDAMIGNSSSGIMEAASFALPVVNIGMRQQGRERGRNIIDVPAETGAIQNALEQALGGKFRARLAGMLNPYGTGDASRTIARVLAETPLDNLLIKEPVLIS